MTIEPKQNVFQTNWSLCSVDNIIGQIGGCASLPPISKSSQIHFMASKIFLPYESFGILDLRGYIACTERATPFTTIDAVFFSSRDSITYTTHFPHTKRISEPTYKLQPTASRTRREARLRHLPKPKDRFRNLPHFSYAASSPNSPPRFSRGSSGIPPLTQDEVQGS